MNNYISGAETVALFAFENQSKWDGTAQNHTASDETYMPFGHGVDIVVNRNNTAEKLYGVGNRNATATIKKNYDGKATINGTFSNAYWFLGILGSNTDAGSVGAYTHTYTEADTVPSFSINTSMELGTTDFNSTLVGCKIESSTITAAVGEAVKFSLDISYRYETISQTAIADNPEIEPPFTFAHGKIELPDGTELAAVQNVEITFAQNPESLYEVGTRFKKANIGKNREYNFTINLAFNDPSVLLSYFLNGTNSATSPSDGSGTEIPNMVLTFTNDEGDIVEMNFTGVSINEESLTQNINEIVKENVTGWARGCSSVIYTNDVEIAPKLATN